ncbi:hypothetical protein QA612_13995 [Evansella sp. AB-P1]|uniref:hypothetical protein n=1 Tax=Evansella sp. AB-P1 TaxID=3037653 RepID=UPI00241DD6CE|nr:hypothetical protein [Evansella sp. AB-P1]MDG5788593.1 hypothetical protein [Evansella sp. AB-P1]
MLKRCLLGTEEGASVPAKSKKEICRHGGRSTVAAKSEKRFAGTEEVATVPAKSKKEVCRHGGVSQ